MLPWPLLQGRWIDGAPTPRIPSCAGECPSPLTSANTRLTEPRETGVHYPIIQQRRCEPNTRSNTTGHLTRPAASYKATSTPSGGGHPLRGPRPSDITSETRTPAAPGARCHSFDPALPAGLRPGGDDPGRRVQRGLISSRRENPDT